MGRREKQTSLIYYYNIGSYRRLNNLIFFDELLLHKLVAIM